MRAEGVKKPSHRPNAVFTEGLRVSGLIHRLIHRLIPGGGEEARHGVVSNQ